MATIADLRKVDRSDLSIKLACSCGCEYGSDPCDYFWMPEGQAFKCQECGEELKLVRKRTVYEDLVR